MTNKFIIIADDLTGSNDTGVQFSKKGLKTGVVTDFSGIKEAINNLDTIVIDTESRFDKKEIAYDKVKEVANIAETEGVNYIYKKIDSTLRGNIGSEIEAAMEGFNSNLAIIVPALPENGRTTVGGIHFVDNIPLEQTEIAQDPITPVKNSFVPEIITLQTDKKVGIIGLQDVIKGTEILKNKIIKLNNQGYEIIVIDANNKSNLKDIADTIALLDKKIIMSGSAGLAEYLPEALNLIDRNENREGTVVIIAGSVSDNTRNQVNYLSSYANIEIIDIDIKRMFLNPEEEKKRILELVNRCVKEDRDIVIRSAKDRQQVKYARDIGREKGLASNNVSDNIAQFFGLLTREICNKQNIKGLMLTGGDIAIKTAKFMEVSGIIIEDEILPAIPYGYFISEKFGEIPIVTKAGGFGKEDTMIKVIEFLKKG
ncbi:four-carbon acid sugar kinase family protein [Clostridiisalibacter paucivorans]|uniref:four-carbon acid sugar kinase family protein n=1 Tax=Clostridiisalibacter paucivorans TaxID=408753 RepID=UPI00047B48F2|nr:four-carbon acid sugar kinase family protein [Clostridiisalibacter paucivorans]